MKKFERARKYLIEEVRGCATCQPYDGGEPVWLGPHTEISDLLCDYDLNDKALRQTLENYNCPRCGADLSDPYSEVMIRSEHDWQADQVLTKCRDKDVIKRLEAFSAFLSKYPYLGMADPSRTGRAIAKALKESKHLTLTDRKFYRARLLDQHSRLFTSREMGAPNPKKVLVPEGRYNHYGQSFLYLSDSKNGAFSELKSHGANVCVIQAYRVNRLSRIVDLRADYENVDPNRSIIELAIIYNGFVQRPAVRGSSWKPEYFVPRFVADVARHTRCRGLLYSSVDGTSENLVVFNPRTHAVRQVGCPSLFRAKSDRTIGRMLHVTRDVQQSQKEQRAGSLVRLFLSPDAR